SVTTNRSMMNRWLCSQARRWLMLPGRFTRRWGQAFAMHASGDRQHASMASRSGGTTRCKMAIRLRLLYEIVMPSTGLAASQDGYGYSEGGQQAAVASNPRR